MVSHVDFSPLKAEFGNKSLKGLYMMKRIGILCATLALVAGCGDTGTNPFSTAAAAANGEDPNAVTSNTGDPIASNRTILPGTINPSANDSIFRVEARSEESGSGYAESISYDGANDLFYVDNLAFDGAGPYTAVSIGGARLGIGPFSVFENSAVAVDSLTTANVSQLSYRALYGVAPDGQSSIAIVRTGGFIEYGFGGYIYQREGGVVLPESGQALYTGTDNYGGLRDFTGRGGLEYVNGDMEVRIDFNDFNEGAGVAGFVTNRRVFDMNGTDITPTILAGLGGGTQLPTLRFEIQPGVLDSNGEMTGDISSVNPVDGEAYESGKYYAIISGNNAQTVTGVVVVTGTDSRNSDHTFRETAGFFATR